MKDIGFYIETLGLLLAFMDTFFPKGIEYLESLVDKIRTIWIKSIISVISLILLLFGVDIFFAPFISEELPWWSGLLILAIVLLLVLLLFLFEKALNLVNFIASGRAVTGIGLVLALCGYSLRFI